MTFRWPWKIFRKETCILPFNVLLLTKLTKAGSKCSFLKGKKLSRLIIFTILMIVIWELQSKEYCWNKAIRSLRTVLKIRGKNISYNLISLLIAFMHLFTLDPYILPMRWSTPHHQSTPRQSVGQQGTTIEGQILICATVNNIQLKYVRILFKSEEKWSRLTVRSPDDAGGNCWG